MFTIMVYSFGFRIKDVTLKLYGKYKILCLLVSPCSHPTSQSGPEIRLETTIGVHTETITMN